MDNTTLRNLASSQFSIVSVELFQHISVPNKGLETRQTLHVLVPAVFVEVFLVHFPANIGIVAKLAFASLVTAPGLEERTKDGLGINTEGYFLRLHGLEQGSFLFLALLFFQLALFS